MIEYKGYLGVVSFDLEIDTFHGTVINTNDVIAFYGSSVTELKKRCSGQLRSTLRFAKNEERNRKNLSLAESRFKQARTTSSHDFERRSFGTFTLNGYIQEVLEKAVAAE